MFESRVFDLGPVGVHQSGFMPTENSRPLHRRVNIRTLVPFSDLVGSSSRARETPLSPSLSLSLARPARFDRAARVAFSNVETNLAAVFDRRIRSFHSVDGRRAILVACRHPKPVQIPRFNFPLSALSLLLRRGLSRRKKGKERKCSAGKRFSSRFSVWKWPRIVEIGSRNAVTLGNEFSAGRGGLTSQARRGGGAGS